MPLTTRKLKVALRPAKPKLPAKKGQVSLKARATLFAKGPRFKSIIGREVAPVAKPKAVKAFGLPTREHLEVLQSVTVNSSWVAAVLLVMYGQAPALGVRFKNGVTVVYTTTNITDFKHMAASASKGKFIWRALYHGVVGAGAPYQIIAARTLGVTRKAAAKVKRRRIPVPF
jgi:hypothetical protein